MGSVVWWCGVRGCGGVGVWGVRCGGEGVGVWGVLCGVVGVQGCGVGVRGRCGNAEVWWCKG